MVQASAADWALILLAGLRRRLAALAGPAGPMDGSDAAHDAGRLLFGATPVRFPVTTAVVDCYADAK